MITIMEQYENSVATYIIKAEHVFFCGKGLKEYNHKQNYVLGEMKKKI